MVGTPATCGHLHNSSGWHIAEEVDEYQQLLWRATMVTIWQSRHRLLSVRRGNFRVSLNLRCHRRGTAEDGPRTAARKHEARFDRCCHARADRDRCAPWNQVISDA